jgi:hypothetical protein
MATLYLRVSDEISDWVKAESEAAGISQAKAVETFLDLIRRRGWRLRQPPAEAVEPD